MEDDLGRATMGNAYSICISQNLEDGTEVATVHGLAAGKRSLRKSSLDLGFERLWRRPGDHMGSVQ